MAIKIVTPPTTTPIDVVGLDRMKGHLHEALDVNENDELITDMVNAAWQLAEDYTWRQFLTATLELRLWNWRSQQPDARYNPYQRAIAIAKPSTQSITSVNYYDAANADQSFTTYDIDEDHIWQLTPQVDTYWPCVRKRPDAIRIRYVAGYGLTLDDMPATLIHAIKLQVGTWFLHRESVDHRTIKELPTATKALLETIEVRDGRLITNERC